MAKEENIGTEIKGPLTLHGKSAKMTRGGREVCGVILANEINSNKATEFIFQFNDKNNVKCISPVTKEEMKDISKYLIN